MTGRAWVAAGALLVAGLGVGWEPTGTEATAGFEYHATTNSLTVGSPWVRAKAPVAASATVAADYRADVITAASVDVVTQATASYTETRHQVGTALDWDRQGDKAAIRYFYGTEPDYLSHTISAEASTEVLERTWRIGGHYSLRLDETGRAGDGSDSFEPVTEHAMGVTVGHAVDRLTDVSVSFDTSFLSGALSSPYRLVPVFGRGSLQRGDISTWMVESVPDRRRRVAGALQVRRALGSDVFVSAAYRYYRDDWEIQSSTGTASLNLPVGDSVWVDVNVRGYRQNEASFYRSLYVEPRTWMTRDRRLGRLWTARAGVAVRGQWEYSGPIGRLNATLFADGYRVRYLNFRAFDDAEVFDRYDGSVGVSAGVSIGGTLR